MRLAGGGEGDLSSRIGALILDLRGGEGDLSSLLLSLVLLGSDESLSSLK